MRGSALMVLGVALYAQSVMAGGNAEAVENFVEAFNRHDVDAMLDVATEDIRWMSLADEQLSVETSNQAQLREAMADYFVNVPSARAEILSNYGDRSVRPYCRGGVLGLRWCREESMQHGGV